MTHDAPDHHEPAGLPDAADPLDLLVDRLVTGEAGLDDWQAWQAHAARDPEAWRSLAVAQRDANALAELVADSDADAARTALPWDLAAAPGGAAGGDLEGHAIGFAPVTAHGAADGPSRSRVRESLGWLAAAAAIVFAVASGRGGTPIASPVPPGGANESAPANLAGLATAGDALARYLELGKGEGLVVREMPQRVLLDSRPAEGGEGFEVLYLRQILERQIVPEFYRPVAEDEHGRATLARYEPRTNDAL